MINLFAFPTPVERLILDTITQRRSFLVLGPSVSSIGQAMNMLLRLLEGRTSVAAIIDQGGQVRPSATTTRAVARDPDHPIINVLRTGPPLPDEMLLLVESLHFADLAGYAEIVKRRQVVAALQLDGIDALGSWFARVNIPAPLPAGSRVMQVSQQGSRPVVHRLVEVAEPDRHASGWIVHHPATSAPATESQLRFSTLYSVTRT